MTYEGENTVMALQCARYLLKNYRQAAGGARLEAPLDYMNLRDTGTAVAVTASSLKDERALEKIFQLRALRMVAECAAQLKELRRSGGLSAEDAWNKSAVALVAAANAHSELYVFQCFATAMQDNAMSMQHFRQPLQELLILYGLSRIEAGAGSFLEFGVLERRNMTTVHALVLEQLAVVRPNAVALVDAFDIPDTVLNSALGARDGDVYRRLWEYAQKEPLNKTEVPEAVTTHLQPLLHGTSKSSSRDNPLISKL